MCRSITTILIMIVPWILALYYFFAHFDRILTQERSSERSSQLRGRLRVGVYRTFSVALVIYNVVIGSQSFPRGTSLQHCERVVG